MSLKTIYFDELGIEIRIHLLGVTIGKIGGSSYAGHKYTDVYELDGD
jgi:hypothetical protein